MYRFPQNKLKYSYEEKINEEATNETSRRAI